MKLSADAKAYASHVDVESGGEEGDNLHAFVRSLLAEAFQAGFDHHKASQRRLEKLAKGKI